VITTIGAVEVGVGVATICARVGLGSGVLTTIGAVEIGVGVATICVGDGVATGVLTTSGGVEVSVDVATACAWDGVGLITERSGVAEGLEVTMGDGAEPPQRIRANIARPTITTPLKIAAAKSMDFLFGGGGGGGEGGVAGGDTTAGEPVQPETHPSLTKPSLRVSQNSWQLLYGSAEWLEIHARRNASFASWRSSGTGV